MQGNIPDLAGASPSNRISELVQNGNKVKPVHPASLHPRRRSLKKRVFYSPPPEERAVSRRGSPPAGRRVTIPDGRTSRPGIGANRQLASQCASTVSAS